MKVLFAVSNENTSQAIIKKYHRRKKRESANKNKRKFGKNTRRI